MNFRSMMKNEQLIAKNDEMGNKFFKMFIRYWLKLNEIFFITDDYLSVASAT